MLSSRVRASFVGDSPPIAEVRRAAVRLADFPFPVLITGETGTGKFELALLMHERSRRAAYPFVDVHCANLTEPLFESTLFGHERGAFTDARELRQGRVEAAAQGTVLFDEVDCLSVPMQAKLLRFADRRSYERVGGKETIRSDASLIFTTNQDLWRMVEEGAFRADLLARMTWFVLRIPPLREHTEDIVLLAGMFLEEARVRFSIPKLRWETSALRLLRQHPWPGNVRELKSVAYVAAYMHSGPTIGVQEVERVLQSRIAPTESGGDAASLAGARTNVEREIIAEALRRTDGNRMHAAKLLKIGRRTLQGKIAKYGLR